MAIWGNRVRLPKLAGGGVGVFQQNGEGSHLGLHNLLSSVHHKQWLCQSLGRRVGPGVCRHQAEVALHTVLRHIYVSLTTLPWNLEVSAHM